LSALYCGKAKANVPKAAKKKSGRGKKDSKEDPKKGNQNRAKPSPPPGDNPEPEKAGGDPYAWKDQMSSEEVDFLVECSEVVHTLEGNPDADSIIYTVMYKYIKKYCGDDAEQVWDMMCTIETDILSPLGHIKEMFTSWRLFLKTISACHAKVVKSREDEALRAGPAQSNDFHPPIPALEEDATIAQEIYRSRPHQPLIPEIQLIEENEPFVVESLDTISQCRQAVLSSLTSGRSTSELYEDILREARQKHKRAKNQHSGKFKLQRPAESYYREKRLTPNNFLINPSLNPLDWRKSNNATLEAVRDYAEKYLAQGPLMERKGLLYPPQDLLKNQTVTLAGSITKVAGEESREFEWNSKSQNNLLWAVHERHLGAHQQADPKHVESFLHFAEAEMSRRGALFLEVYNPQQSLMEYPDRQPWPEAKKTMYKQNILKAFTDPDFKGLDCSYIAMAKSGEVNLCYEEFIVDDEGYTL